MENTMWQNDTDLLENVIVMCNEMTAMMIECYKDVIALQVVCGENIQIRCDRQSDRRVR